ncbi:hypothetical protein D3C78_1023160 [compost metagenome]
MHVDCISGSPIGAGTGLDTQRLAILDMVAILYFESGVEVQDLSQNFSSRRIVDRNGTECPSGFHMACDRTRHRHGSVTAIHQQDKVFLDKRSSIAYGTNFLEASIDFRIIASSFSAGGRVMLFQIVV